MQKAELRETVLDRFNSDHKIAKELKDAPKVNAVEKFAKRNPFDKTSNKQMGHAADEVSTNSEALADMVDVIAEHRKCALPTQVVEDIIGAGKNNTKARYGPKFRAPEAAPAAALRAQVLNDRHDFKTVDLTGHLQYKGK